MFKQVHRYSNSVGTMHPKQSAVLSLFSTSDDFSGPDAEASIIPVAFQTTDYIGGVLSKGQQFSIFKKKHAEEAAVAYNYLISCESFDTFIEGAKRLRKILNEGMYLYVISVALLYRKDKGGALIPPLHQVNPRSYFPGTAIKQAFDRAHSSLSPTDTQPLHFFTGTNRDPEFKIAWWREDCGLNSHHFHWHQVYPHRGINKKTKDRQGELFYYMHEQMLARYDAERLAVGLMRVIPYANWQLPITEGYNSHLTDCYGTYHFSARPAGMILTDNWRDPSDPALVIQQEYHRNRILDAINTGKFKKPDGTEQDVDIVGLGAAIEASISSPNRDLYGDVGIHNRGHEILAGITDPDNRYLQAAGVMSDVVAAVRDPIFFRWHKFIDDLFFLHKIKLTPYTQDELDFSNVTVKSVQVKSSTGQAIEPNVLYTCMDDVKVDIQHDMFLQNKKLYTPNTPVNVIVKQVNHDEFEYIINVVSTSVMKAAIRIFIAPSFNEYNVRFTSLDIQRRLFIELDKFVYTLRVGENIVSRSSMLSSVIKPCDVPMEQLKTRTTTGDGTCTCPSDRYCECGWPLNMLLPRGTATGMPFDLFVMVTDWASDTDDLDRGTSYCGVRDDKYPDKRPMGFPFDRRFDRKTKDEDFGLREFVAENSNIKAIPIIIRCVSGI